jgi:integrase/recombinase XerD
MELINGLPQHAAPLSAPAPLDTWLDIGGRYLQYLAIRGHTVQGRCNSKRYLDDFIEWAVCHGIASPQQVGEQTLCDYLLHLHNYRKRDGQPLASVSKRSKLIPLRGFFRWCCKHKIIPADPSCDIDLPKHPRQLPRITLSVEEVERILSGPDVGTVIGLRDRAALELLYATGIRRMEVAALDRADLDMARHRLLVRQGKGGKDRIVPMGERAALWLARYLQEAWPALCAGGTQSRVFVSRQGKALNLAWLSTVISQRVTQADIGKRGACHLFRHSMATLMLEGGADIRYIQAMLGHADLSSTQIYTQVAVHQLQQVHARTHPGVGGKA